MKASSLELQQQLALISSEKTQLDLKLQQAQSSLTEVRHQILVSQNYRSSPHQAQQVVKLRVSEHAAEKAAKEKYQEEAETAAQKIKQLKERQDVITAAGSHNVSENELQLKEERNKLFVSFKLGFNVPGLTTCPIETPAMLVLWTQYEATGHHKVFPQ